MREVTWRGLRVMATIYYPVVSFHHMSGLIDAVELQAVSVKMGISSFIPFVAAKRKETIASALLRVREFNHKHSQGM